MPHSDIDYTKYQQIIRTAIRDVNEGITFRRDGKCIALKEIKEKEILLTLNCKTPLVHAARSLSALTRNLTCNYPESFSPFIYNRTLFHMDLLSQDSSFGDLDIFDITDTDLLKGVIDLLFTHTTTTKAEAEIREQTINKIKELVRPYIKK